MADVYETVFAEGYSAYRKLLRIKDNPYAGYNDKLARVWIDGWWDAFYGDQ